MTSASSCPALALPKPEPRRKAKDRKQRHEAKVKREVRAEVWALSCGLCGLCGQPMGSEDGEMHERVFRSRTRGLPPELRFNVDNCLRVHARCHRGPKGVHK